MLHLKKLFLLFAMITLSLPSRGSTKIGDLYYNLDDSSMTAEVTYEIYDDEENYKNLSGALSIPESVLSNGETYSVTSIGELAFKGCSVLTSFEIPLSVTEIGDNAFYNCPEITEITIPESVTFIGKNAFFTGENLTTLRYNAIDCEFDNKDGDIVYYTFKPTINNLEIGDKVKTIPQYFVVFCEDIKQVSIPNSVTDIGEGSFAECNKLENIEIGNSVASIGYTAFYNCITLESIEIPNSVTEIGEWAFQGCLCLSDVKLGNSLTSIQTGTFSECIGLKSVTIPNSVTSIGDHAFSRCSSLTTIFMGENVEYIGWCAFKNCNRLEEIAVAALTPPTCDNTPFSAGTYKTATLFVPEREMNLYKQLEPWNQFFKLKNIDEYEGNNGENNGDNAVDDVYGETNAVFDVYTLQGVCVKHQATQEEIEDLTPGIYIRNGKKVILK